MELISYILQFESEVFLNLYVNFESCSRIAMSIHDFTGSKPGGGGGGANPRSDPLHKQSTLLLKSTKVNIYILLNLTCNEIN